MTTIPAVPKPLFSTIRESKSIVNVSHFSFGISGIDASMPLIPKEKCETLTMDFDSLMVEKSGLGTAGIVVINKDQDIIKCI